MCKYANAKNSNKQTEIIAEQLRLDFIMANMNLEM